MKEVEYNCPFCGTLLKGVDVDRPTPVRCPIILVESDREKYPQEVARVCEWLKVDTLPWTQRCGRIYLRMPSR